MSELVEIGVDGMKLDVNAHAGNGLRWAMNVVFRKPGVAEPRPGFDLDTGTITGERAVTMLPAGFSFRNRITTSDIPRSGVKVM